MDFNLDRGAQTIPPPPIHPSNSQFGPGIVFLNHLLLGLVLGLLLGFDAPQILRDVLLKIDRAPYRLHSLSSALPIPRFVLCGSP
jgi:NhaP-type Na+/H+ or K+/H+ antiporter